MNNRVWHITSLDLEPYCEAFKCPKLRKKHRGGKRCNRKCPKKGTVLARIGVKRSRRKSKLMGL